MTRGGRDKASERDGGLPRRCIATGEAQPREGLIRFVADPQGVVTPDLAEKLPGRGVWVRADREALEKAVTKNLFARGLKRAVTVPEGLSGRVEALLQRRLVDGIALARKAGLAVCGFERCREALESGRVALLFAALDGAEDGKAKLARLAGEATISPALAGHELGLAFGRDSVIHAALLDGGATTRAIRDARRLEGFRTECGRRVPSSEAAT